MQDRAKIAYDVFRGGFRGALRTPPHWDALDSWIRDALVVAYAQGKIDGNGAFSRAKAEAYTKRQPGDH